jgi:hypothetical protein
MTRFRHNDGPVAALWTAQNRMAAFYTGVLRQGNPVAKSGTNRGPEGGWSDELFGPNSRMTPLKASPSVAPAGRFQPADQSPPSRLAADGEGFGVLRDASERDDRTGRLRTRSTSGPIRGTRTW